jgi:hypothetical protein
MWLRASGRTPVLPPREVSSHAIVWLRARGGSLCCTSTKGGLPCCYVAPCPWWLHLPERRAPRLSHSSTFLDTLWFCLHERQALMPQRGSSRATHMVSLGMTFNAPNAQCLMPKSMPYTYHDTACTHAVEQSKGTNRSSGELHILSK